jgi:DNA-binding response OmpR family regulator
LPFGKVINKFRDNVPNGTGCPLAGGFSGVVFSTSEVKRTVKPKVLIVDDEDFFRTLVANGFEREGFTVLQADNGEDGIEVAKSELPELILLDLVMPKLLGFEVCQILRKDQRFTKTAIIIMSAKSYKPDMDKAAELGADDYVVKPFEFNDLLSVAREQMIKRKNAS